MHISIINRIDSTLESMGKGRPWLCSEAGLASNYIARCSAPGYTPNVEAICSIARVLNVSVEWLMTGSNVLDDIPQDIRAIANNCRQLSEGQRRAVNALIVELSKCDQ